MRRPPGTDGFFFLEAYDRVRPKERFTCAVRGCAACPGRMPAIPARGGCGARLQDEPGLGSSIEKKVHGSRLAPLTPEAPDHAVYDAFIRRSVPARYPGCAPRDAASRRTNAKQQPSSSAERDQLAVIGLVRAIWMWCDIPHGIRRSLLGSTSLRAAYRFGLRL